MFYLPCQKAERENCIAPLSLEFFRAFGCGRRSLAGARQEGQTQKNKKERLRGCRCSIPLGLTLDHIYIGMPSTRVTIAACHQTARPKRKGEYITPSVIREMKEETGLVIENPRLCGIKEFHKSSDGKRYIVFLYVANQYTGELKPSNEGEVFWYPLSKLRTCGKLIDGFEDMLSVFTEDDISEVFYERLDDGLTTVYY